MKMNGRSMQSRKGSCLLHHGGLFAKIFLGHGCEIKLAFRRTFPQKLGVHFFGQGLNLRMELSTFQRIKLQHHTVGFHLGALAMQGFHLIGIALLLKHSAHFEGSGLFVIQIHQLS